MEIVSTSAQGTYRSWSLSHPYTDTHKSTHVLLCNILTYQPKQGLIPYLRPAPEKNASQGAVFKEEEDEDVNSTSEVQKTKQPITATHVPYYPQSTNQQHQIQGSATLGR